MPAINAGQSNALEVVSRQRVRNPSSCDR